MAKKYRFSPPPISCEKKHQQDEVAVLDKERNRLRDNGEDSLHMALENRKLLQASIRPSKTVTVQESVASPVRLPDKSEATVTNNLCSDCGDEPEDEMTADKDSAKSGIVHKDTESASKMSMDEVETPTSNKHALGADEKLTNRIDSPMVACSFKQSTVARFLGSDNRNPLRSVQLAWKHHIMEARDTVKPSHQTPKRPTSQTIKAADKPADVLPSTFKNDGCFVAIVRHTGETSHSVSVNAHLEKRENWCPRSSLMDSDDEAGDEIIGDGVPSAWSAANPSDDGGEWTELSAGEDQERSHGNGVNLAIYCPRVRGPMPGYWNSTVVSSDAKAGILAGIVKTDTTDSLQDTNDDSSVQALSVPTSASQKKVLGTSPCQDTLSQRSPPTSPFDTYEMTPAKDSDEDSDSDTNSDDSDYGEAGKPRAKYIPVWAREENLNELWKAQQQRSDNPDDIFLPATTCDEKAIFGNP